MLIISVVYPEENLLMGDNIIYAEAAFLWVQNLASTELGIDINRIFLGGHSQGGYLVTRLNTMHSIDGVIANCPGPLDMRYRCRLEEEGTMELSNQCRQLWETYGSTVENPAPIMQYPFSILLRGINLLFSLYRAWKMRQFSYIRGQYLKKRLTVAPIVLRLKL